MDFMDLVLGTFIAGSVFSGWKSGLVRQVIGLVMLFVAFVAGAYLRGPAGAIVAAVVSKVPAAYTEMVGYVVAFVVVFILGNIVVGRLVGTIHLAGVSALADRVIGAGLGGVVAVLIATSAIAILDTFYGQPNQLGKTVSGVLLLSVVHDGLKGSWIAATLRHTTVPLILTILGPFIPRDIKLPFLK